MSTRRAYTVSPDIAARVSIWATRGLESLWLLTVVLVPLAFLDRDYVKSEAVIAYVELPKIALLRTLVALMTALWLIEWALQGRFPFESLFSGGRLEFHPAGWPGRFRGWVGERPTRWLFLAVWFFLGTTLLSTVLSGSLNVSLWGEVPGQDGYPAFTVVAYVLLFAIMATHLKTSAQMWRLFGAIAVAGVVTAGYGILQHYGYDFLGLTESTGGGSRQVASFMGNNIFSAAVMLMTIPISVVAGALTLRQPPDTTGGLRGWLGPWMLTVAMAGFWGIVLAVQLLGITFTFARGPWGGALLALASLLVLAVFFAGWRYSTRAASLLALSLAMIMAVLLWQGSISSLGPSPALGAISVAVGLAWVAAVLAPWRALRLVSLALGLAVALAFAAILATLWFKGGGDASIGEPEPAAAVDPTAAQVVDRLASVKGEVLSGFGGRGTHWRVSWELIRDHPWFSFDSLSLSWLRPLIGYGPDLFRYTYLQRSPPEGPSLLPLEPDHAHNFFIHQTVEQGFLGLMSSLGLFAAVFWVGGYRLFRQRQGWSTVHRLILAGLLAIFVGRFLEMMVGVARVSDLTILWVLLAAFAALPRLTEGSQAAPGAAPEPAPRPRNPRQRSRSSRAFSSRAPAVSWRLFWRLAVVAWLVGAVATLTWVKTVNNVRAAVKVGDAAESFQRGDYQAALADLNRAIDLAPDVSSYYNYKANVYLAYQIRKPAVREPGCSSQQAMGYDECLSFQAYLSNLEGVARRPFYYRSHLALANSAYNLGGTELIVDADGEVPGTRTINLRDETVRYYNESLALVPASWTIRIELAEAYIEAGKPEAALEVLDESLAITGDSGDSARAMLLKGQAYMEWGKPEMALESMERFVERFSPETAAARGVFDIMGKAYDELGQLEKAATMFLQQGVAYRDSNEPAKSAQSFGLSADAFERLLKPQSAADALFFQGQAYVSLGELQKSAESLEESARLDPAGAPARGVHLRLAQVYGSLLKTELGRDAGPSGSLIDHGLNDLAELAASLERNADAYDKPSQADLASKFFFQLGLASRDDRQLAAAAELLEASAQLNAALERPELAGP